MKYAILMGLNKIDPEYYGTDGALRGCINDVNTWINLIKPDEFQVLLNEEATPENFLGCLHSVKVKAVEGDTIYIMYSGHGTQVPSTSKSEKDELDEAFCFYNRIFLDKNFNNNLATIKKGIKVVGIFDCCFSGGVHRNALGIRKSIKATLPIPAPIPIKSRILKCSFLSINASAESQPALDGEVNGLFTETMFKTYTGHPLLSWTKAASELVTQQKINFKSYGTKFDWSTFVL
jgi:hypothetical protein